MSGLGSQYTVNLDRYPWSKLMIVIKIEPNWTCKFKWVYNFLLSNHFLTISSLFRILFFNVKVKTRDTTALTLYKSITTGVNTGHGSYHTRTDEIKIDCNVVTRSCDSRSRSKLNDHDQLRCEFMLF